MFTPNGWESDLFTPNVVGAARSGTTSKCKIDAAPDEDILHYWPDAETTSIRLNDPPVSCDWSLDLLLRKMV